MADTPKPKRRPPRPPEPKPGLDEQLADAAGALRDRGREDAADQVERLRRMLED